MFRCASATRSWWRRDLRRYFLSARSTIRHSRRRAMTPDVPLGLQLAIVSGALIGLGLALLVIRLLPDEPEIGRAHV